MTFDFGNNLSPSSGTYKGHDPEDVFVLPKCGLSQIEFCLYAWENDYRLSKMNLMPREGDLVMTLKGAVGYNKK